MNDQERAELARFRDRQARLEEELRQLSTQLKAFEERLSNPKDDVLAQGRVTEGESSSIEPLPQPVTPGPAQPRAIPPIIREFSAKPTEVPLASTRAEALSTESVIAEALSVGRSKGATEEAIISAATRLPAETEPISAKASS